MIYRVLKPLRVLISLLFLFGLSYIFVDFTRNIAAGIVNGFTYLQFIPSILKFINLLSWGSAGFIFILALTLLLGRVYCSTICPLGIFQDISAWISKKFRIRNKVYRYTKPLNWLRYGFLALAILVFLLGSALTFNMLDPFSNFGKIFSDLFRPIYAFLNNQLAAILESQKIYLMAPVDLKPLNILTLIFPILFLSLILWLSLSRARLYCNSVCPVGTFLGLVSRFSIYKIQFDKNTCNKCGKCSVACKSFCIDIKQQNVDFSRCVGCFNCLKVCPSASMIIASGRRKNAIKSSLVDMDKRDFVAQSIGLILSLTFLPRMARAGPDTTKIVHSIVSKSEKDIPKNKKPTIHPEKKNFPVSPPGSVSIAHFNETCTACHLCVTVCPTKVLKPSMLEYGLIGCMQPHMNYHVAYCTFECTECTKVCPTGALLPMIVEKKKRNQMGKVIFEKENCIPYVEGTACGSCSEHCPTQAVKMITFDKGSLTMPKTDQDLCIGCGACEEACPTRPYRAIWVDGNQEHQVSKKPAEEKIKEEVKEDFPF
jgi:ferredoxin